MSVSSDSLPRRADTIVDILRRRSQEQPDARAYVFLVEGEILEPRSITYAELDRQARTIARRLLESNQPGDRVLLLYPPGLEFIAAFYGALYAGIVAVPAYPPRNNSQVPRLEAIMADASVSHAMTTAKTLTSVRSFVTKHPRFGALQWITTDDLAIDDAAIAIDAAPESLALLQYTSGSTGTPKGVMVSHSNVTYNSLYIQQSFSLGRHSVSASWLPSFHDMGLIDGVIQPLYTGFLGVILPPVSFVQKPVRWLQAVSHFKATHGGGPNFGYDLCAQKVTEEQSAGLDLSSWTSAYNGAEPVRADTLKRFAERFKANGVKLRTLYPCYGLAETTLMVSGGHISEDPVFQTVDKQSLERDRVQVIAANADVDRTAAGGQELVSSGRMILDTVVRIVDPDTRIECDAERVGEVWVSGPTVCQGYWQRPDETDATFRGFMADGSGPYLRTGDLGFIHKRELFITGRAKDLIIIRGRNLYPQDVEAAAEAAHPALKAGAGIAFAVDSDMSRGDSRGGNEHLVLVQELQRQALKNTPVDEIARAIVKAVADAHDVEVSAVVLIKTGAIPKTSSGKLQRRKARELYLSSELDEIGRWIAGAQENDAAPATANNPSEASLSGNAISDWLADRVAARAKRPVQRIDRTAPFSSFGFDSLALVELSGDLSEFLKRDLAPTLLYDFPSIDRLSRHLAGETADASAMAAASAEPIAIVGASCRLPGGAIDINSFWQLLQNGIDAITEVPASRWPRASTTAPRFAGVLDNIDQFDAEFFGIVPREAAAIDPQHRLMLELTWEALESAGIAPETLAGSATGVFVGISTQEYLGLQLQAGASAYTGSGNALSAASGRISYALGLEGPSLSIDTACSSSLVAVHLACQSLRRGESTAAIVGGVNLLISPGLSETFAKAGMMSPDGRCKTFDSRADGYVRSEGGAVVVLKPLSKAVASGDRVLAVIRGSAVNQDGRSNGLTAPNGPSQERVIRAALADAALDAKDISYIEAHGTGTSLGDPIEVRALGSVFGDRREPLVVGSVKTNLGHLEAAAGITGLLKIVAALGANEIPPTLHFSSPNPHIPWAQLPISIATERRSWPANDSNPRRAGVSSFGFTGTNAHVIVEQAPNDASIQQTSVFRDVFVLPVSARTPKALQLAATNYAALLDAQPSSLSHACFTAAVGRSHFSERLAVSGTSAAEIASALRSRAASLLEQRQREDSLETPRFAWMFTGQGSQKIGMGAELYKAEPVFRAEIDRCDALFNELRGVSLSALMFGAASSSANLNDTEWTQPALYALEVALAAQWRHWGAAPAAVIGHSVGEFAAAAVAGVFTVEDGLRLVAARGQLMQQLPAGGAMLSVFADEPVVQRAIADSGLAAIAAVNAADETVISGPQDALDRIAASLNQQGIKSRALTVSHAFHSPLMRPMLDAFARVLETIRFSTPTIDVISNLTGARAGSEIATTDYWLRHVMAPVRFRDGLRTLADAGIRHYLELGPHPVLSSLGARNSDRADDVWLASMTSGRKTVNESRQIVDTLARVYECGASIDWAHVYEGSGAKRIAVPTYPFQRERHWVDASGSSSPQDAVAFSSERHPILGLKLPPIAALPQTTIWQAADVHEHALWTSYRVGRQSLLPTSAYIEMITAAASAVLDAGSVVIERSVFVDAERAAVTPEVEIQVSGKRLGRAIADVSVQLRPNSRSEWTEVASARARTTVQPQAITVASTPSIDLGVMFFNGSDTGEADRYRLVMETARFADRNGFSSVWAPERHYTSFGGLYPNPSVLHAAIARETRQIRLMAGSVVLPLHHPLRVVEDWALVDNLSNGRAGVSVATGWNPDDFAMFPDRYKDRREMIFDQIPLLQRLWRGESMDATSGTGKAIRVRTQPSPVQKELPLWVTAAGNPESFARAGSIGANLLTHLLDQDAYEMKGKVAIYRDARAKAGHDPAAGRVTVMVHTFLGDDVETVRELVRAPYCQYIKDNIGLLKGLAYSRGTNFNIDTLSEQDVDEFVSFLYDRFFSTRALLGTPESCMPLVRQLAESGVNEIACLVDFGPPTSLVVRHLPHLARLRERVSAPARGAAAAVLPPAKIADVQSRCSEHFAAAAFYRRLQSRGIHIGSALQCAADFWRCDGEALARAEESVAAQPTELATHAFMAAIPSAAFSSASEGVFVSTSFGGFEMLLPNERIAWSRAIVDDASRTGGAFSGRIELLSESGEIVARIAQFGVRRAAADETVACPAADAGLYEVQWEAHPRRTAVRAVAKSGAWIVLGDASGVADAVAPHLTSAGHAVVVVRPRDVDYLDVVAVRAFVSEVAQRHGAIAGVLHAWSLDAPATDALTDAALAEQQALGCGALLHVMQAVAPLPSSPRVWIVTRNAQPAGSNPTPTAVAQSMVWGLGRAIAVEHPDNWGGLIDLSPASAADDAGLIAAELLGSDGEDQIAHRGGQRFVPRLVPRDMPAVSTTEFDPTASYLITGGVGGLGHHVARWMIDSGVTDLVLTGLRARDRSAVRDLERDGVRIEVAAADASDRAAMTALVGNIAARGKALKGIVHLAGVPEDTVIVDSKYEHGRRVMAPKVAGGWIMHDISRHLPLDFFVSFSSISAVWGSRGQPFYGAANHFLDALTAYRRLSGLPMVTVSWGPWSEGGMVDGDGLARLERMGLRAMPPPHAIDKLARLVAAASEQRVVVDVDWPVFKELFESRSARPILSRVGQSSMQAGSTDTELARELRGLSADAAHVKVSDVVRASVMSSLGWSGDRTLEPRRGFFDLGMDSLMALDLKNRLQDAFGLPLRATVVFNYSTVESLADFLAQQFAPASGRAAAVESASAPMMDSPETLSDEDALKFFDEQLAAAEIPGKSGWSKKDE